VSLQSFFSIQSVSPLIFNLINDALYTLEHKELKVQPKIIQFDFLNSERNWMGEVNELIFLVEIKPG
jgi:hypothetical protein